MTNTQLTPEDLFEIEARLAAAMPGPWTTDNLMDVANLIDEVKRLHGLLSQTPLDIVKIMNDNARLREVLKVIADELCIREVKKIEYDKNIPICKEYDYPNCAVCIARKALLDVDAGKDHDDFG